VTGTEDLVREATARLAAAGCVAADLEADELVAAASDEAALEALMVRRQRGEPLAWLTGSITFCGHLIRVGRGVYVPRLQSEELARRAVERLPTAPDSLAADLCTGAGAVAVHMMSARRGARVVGVDIDPTAVACAHRNRVPAVLGDLGSSLRSGVFNVVTAVAPYVPTDERHLLPADVQRYEPSHSIDGGADGLDVVRRIVLCAARLLVPGGWLLVEVGGAQDRGLAAALSRAGFGPADPWFDDEGDLRGITARRGGVPDRTEPVAGTVPPTSKSAAGGKMPPTRAR
jgi:release factor glutamine methyltransferase